MSSTQCYTWINGNVYSFTSVPCGTSHLGFHNGTSGVQTYCEQGDTCGANSICKWGNGNHPLLGSAFYVSGCTDPDFKDPLCRKDCKQYQSESDIVSVRGSTWACCGKTSDGLNRPNCSEPLMDQVYDLRWSAKQFPGPIDKALIAAVSTTMPASTTVKASSSIHSSVAPTSSSAAPPTKPASGLSIIAKAGIGAGTSVGALVFVGGLIAFFGLRRKRQKPFKLQSFVGENGPIGGELDAQQIYGSGYQRERKKTTYYNEVPVQHSSELDTTQSVRELPA